MPKHKESATPNSPPNQHKPRPHHKQSIENMMQNVWTDGGGGNSGDQKSTQSTKSGKHHKSRKSPTAESSDSDWALRQRATRALDRLASSNQANVKVPMVPKRYPRSASGASKGSSGRSQKTIVTEDGGGDEEFEIEITFDWRAPPSKYADQPIPPPWPLQKAVANKKAGNQKK